jgi:hypothetical protein
MKSISDKIKKIKIHTTVKKKSETKANVERDIHFFFRYSKWSNAYRAR